MAAANSTDSKLSATVNKVTCATLKQLEDMTELETEFSKTPETIVVTITIENTKDGDQHELDEAMIEIEPQNGIVKIRDILSALKNFYENEVDDEVISHLEGEEEDDGERHKPEFSENLSDIKGFETYKQDGIKPKNIQLVSDQFYLKGILLDSESETLDVMCDTTLTE